MAMRSRLWAPERVSCLKAITGTVSPAAKGNNLLSELGRCPGILLQSLGLSQEPLRHGAGCLNKNPESCLHRAPNTSPGQQSMDQPGRGYSERRGDQYAWEGRASQLEASGAAGARCSGKRQRKPAQHWECAPVGLPLPGLLPSSPGLWVS